MTELAISYSAVTLQVLLDRAAHRNVLNFFRGKPDYVKDELLKQLHRQLLSAKAVLGDAEEEKIMDSIVKEWVDMLQDVMGDAENLLDEIVTNIDRISYADRVKEYFKSVNPRLEMINKRLADVVDLKDKLGLKEGKAERESPLSLPTTQFRDESELLHGRDSDKKIIIEKLKSANGNKKGVTVVAIVGMAGVGKTTLCQHIFHDPQLKEIFNLKFWIHVSDKFDVLDITKKIYTSITSSNTEITDLNLLQEKLSSRLRGKKFLLVLDDFWCEKPHEWDLIKRPLTMKISGSSVIVTTRIENVAHAVRAAHVHHLPLLNDDDCSKIFFQHAFENNEGADPNETLMEIGKAIAKKCNGLPLSSRVLGSLLRSTDDAQKWDAVLHSKMWHLPTEKNIIVPALKVSYHHLPSHLKRCFAFCSIFPRGCVVRKWILIFLWMAHDLLQSKDGKTMERVGDECFQELLSRSFLQRSPTGSPLQRSLSGNYSRSWSILPRSGSFQQRSSRNDLRLFLAGSTSNYSKSFLPGSTSNYSKSFLPGSTSNDLDFVIHDLMHELAQCMGGEIFYRFEGGNLNDIPQKVRHLSFLREKIDPPDQFEKFHDLLQLRTFLSVSPDPQTSSTRGSLEIPLERLGSLRVLSLSKFSITVLPDSIENLKHLRFLNLSKTIIKELPNLSLPNLITLLLSECDSLTQLPSNLTKLTTLRHLDVSGKRLTHFPPKFSELKSLQMLTNFFAGGDNSASRISELGGLTQLCDTLSIVHLQKVRDAADASKANLKEMKFLKKLNLKWAGTVHNEVREKAVLHNLEPHKFLQELKVEGYGGKEFPQWLGLPSFSNMVSIYLIDCSYCLSLPPLGQLRSLKTLRIESMTSLKSVNPEFYGPSQGTPFRSLKSLSFVKMSEWAEWPRAHFPSLQELCIDGCPSLTGNLNHHMPLLNKLEIFECGSLELLPHELQALEFLHLRCCAKLNCLQLSSFPSLCYLHIQSCRSLQSLSTPESQQHNDSLEILVLDDCQKFNCLQLSSFPNLCHLRIRSCCSLRSLSIPLEQHHDSLEILVLDNCQNFNSLPAGGWGTPYLNSLSISNCPLLVQRFQRVTAYQQLRYHLRSNFSIDEIIQEEPLAVK